MPSCSQCQKSFEITSREAALFKKFGFESNGLCFECDQKARICFRNGRKLYNRKCDATGEQIISCYSPDKPYKVFRNDIWWGDTWDARDYARDFDFFRPFFDQFLELQLSVPRMALSNANNENSEFCNMTVYNKNCYLVFGGDYNEDVQYGDLCFHNRDSFDLDQSNENEQCYFLSDSTKCYGCQFVFDSKNCDHCYYLSDCSSCSECILCAGLSQKSYCILNKQYSKEEYMEKKNALITGSHKQRSENWKNFLGLLGNRIVKFAHQVGCENCTGDYIYNSKNCQNCFEVSNGEDLYDVILSPDAKDLFQCSFIGHHSELCYQVQSSVKATNCQFLYLGSESSDIAYSEAIFSCHDCFGCVCLKHKNHCIFNKQYSKEDYGKLKTQIVEHMKKTGEWGKFFPHNISCFGYNESTVNDYFPMTKDEALSQGFKWCNYPEIKPKSDRTISSDNLPDSILEITDDILNSAIECEKSKRLFKITPQELKFYRKNNLPIPRLHSDERHNQRADLRNPRKLFPRACAKCAKPLQSTYPPDRPETIYCEQCYQQAIY